MRFARYSSIYHPILEYTVCLDKVGHTFPTLYKDLGKNIVQFCDQKMAV